MIIKYLFLIIKMFILLICLRLKLINNFKDSLFYYKIEFNNSLLFSFLISLPFSIQFQWVSIHFSPSPKMPLIQFHHFLHTIFHQILGFHHRLIQIISNKQHPNQYHIQHNSINILQLYQQRISYKEQLKNDPNTYSKYRLSS